MIYYHSGLTTEVKGNDNYGSTGVAKKNKWGTTKIQLFLVLSI